MDRTSSETQGGAQVSDGSTRRIEPHAGAHAGGSNLDEPETHEAAPDPEKLAEPRLSQRELEPPRNVEGLSILREIGRGGMGVVYLAREARWGREVALKIVPPGLTDRQTRRFLEEAFVTGQLQHPAIAPIYRMGRTEDGRDYYTMKRVQGQTLAQLLKQAREHPAKGREEFPLRRRVAILLAACEGVAYAHDRGVIHRDLKPSNVMVGEYGEVYVLDWGLARIVYGGRHPNESPDLSELAGPAPAPAGPDDTAAGGGRSDGSTQRIRLVSGTPAYMSPEQARGEPELDARSDVWSLGAILYQILTFYPPIVADSSSETLRLAALGQVSALERYPEGRQAPRDLADVLERALQADPAKRYADARQMVEDLRAYLDGRGRWRLAYEWHCGQGAPPAEEWQPVLGAWNQDAEGLYPEKRSSQGALLLTTARFPGDVRVELRGRAKLERPEGGELSIFIGAPEPEAGVNETDGYALQFGCDANGAAKICKDDVDVVINPEARIAANREYTVSAERIGNRLGLSVDGEELAHFEDLFPLGGTRVGLYGWGDGARIESVKIYRRAMDAVVSCMAVPDHDYNRGRFAEALAGYRRIAEELAGREEGFMARFKAGLSRLESNDALGAESEFAKLDGTSGEVLAQLGRSLLSAREGDLRRELLRLSGARRVGADTRFQSYVQARLWMRAEELEAQGQHESSLSFFQEALKSEPEGGVRRARAQFVICACHFSLGHDREALRALEEATREGDLPPDGAYQVYQLAVRHFTSQGRWAQALDACARAEQAPGLGSRARLLRADAEWQRGEYGRAARAVEQGLALEPAERVRVELFLQRALVERELGRLDAALNLLQEAEAVPTPAPLDDVNIERGWTLAMRGQADEALEALAERLRVNTHAARMKLLREIGTLSFLRGHLNRAHDCFQQVLLNLPRSSVGMRLACALDLGLALLALGEEARAREQFQEAAANPARALSKTLAQRFLDWREGEPLPEPPEPGRDCAWMQRPLYFYYLGEFAYLSRRREEAVRGLHRAVIEAPSPYRHAAWMAALRLGQLGETVPGGAPSFVPLE